MEMNRSCYLDKCLSCSGNYMAKYRVSLLQNVLLGTRVQARNTVSLTPHTDEERILQL